MEEIIAIEDLWEDSWLLLDAMGASEGRNLMVRRLFFQCHSLGSGLISKKNFLFILTT